MRATFAALVAFTALATPSEAAVQRWNPKAPENAQLLPGFSYATVEPVLQNIGAHYQRVAGRAGPVLNVTFANGRKAVLAMGGCTGNASCKWLSIQSRWTRIANSPASTVAAEIERFNQNYSFAKVYLGADGGPSMQRYLTADYGFIRGNLAVNLLAFAAQADRFAVDVLAPLERR